MNPLKTARRWRGLTWGEKVKEFGKSFLRITVLLRSIRKKAAEGNSRSRFYEIFISYNGENSNSVDTSMTK